MSFVPPTSKRPGSSGFKIPAAKSAHETVGSMGDINTQGELLHAGPLGIDCAAQSRLGNLA